MKPEQLEAEWKTLTDEQKNKVMVLINKHLELKQKLYEVCEPSPLDNNPDNVPEYLPGSVKSADVADGITSLGCELCDGEWFYENDFERELHFTHYAVDHILVHHMDLIK